MEKSSHAIAIWLYLATRIYIASGHGERRRPQRFLRLHALRGHHFLLQKKWAADHGQVVKVSKQVNKNGFVLTAWICLGVFTQTYLDSNLWDSGCSGWAMASRIAPCSAPAPQQAQLRGALKRPTAGSSLKLRGLKLAFDCERFVWKVTQSLVILKRPKLGTTRRRQGEKTFRARWWHCWDLWPQRGGDIKANAAEGPGFKSQSDMLSSFPQVFNCPSVSW